MSVEYAIYLSYEHECICPNPHKYSGSARGVMVIVAGNGHSNTSSNPGRD